MKLTVQDRIDPPEAILIKPGVRLWADTDSDNRIINLVIETQQGHQLIEVKHGKLCQALKKVEDAIN